MCLDELGNSLPVRDPVESSVVGSHPFHDTRGDQTGEMERERGLTHAEAALKVRKTGCRIRSELKENLTGSSTAKDDEDASVRPRNARVEVSVSST
jgi:hypothetical protein